MLGQWKNAKLRSANKALDAGRLDDAVQLATSADLLSGQADKLVARLRDALTARVRTRLQAGQFTDAMTDIGKLAQLAALTPEVLALQQRARAAIDANRLTAEVRDGMLAQAQQNLRAGHLDSARQVLRDAPDDGQRNALERDLQSREQRIAQLMETARAALAREDILAACALWTQAVTQRGQNRDTEELGAELARRISARVDQWLSAGNLGQLVAALQATAGIRQARSDLARLSMLQQAIQNASRQLAAGQFSELNETLARLAAHCSAGIPDWVSKAMRSVRDIDAARTDLLASPLGALGPSVSSSTQSAAPVAGLFQSGAGSAAEPTFNRSMLLVDGAGSSLILTSDLLRIGRANGRTPVDIPLPADIQSHHADVARTGDDYFLIAHGPVRVNDRGVSRTLLRDGDRVRLGESPEFVFRRPSNRSNTACLRLSSRCRLPQDVGQVLFFNETCLIGPQPHCHVQAREASAVLLLFESAGQLVLRSLVGGAGTPLAPGRPIEAQDVRITLTPYLVGPEARI